MAHVELHEPGLQRLLNSQKGPVAGFVSAKAHIVKDFAYQRASGRPGPRVRSGDLRRHLKVIMLQDSNGPHAAVGTDAGGGHHDPNYTRLVELGGVAATKKGAKPYAYPYLVPALGDAGFRHR